jgi:hypothetical protein
MDVWFRVGRQALQIIQHVLQEPGHAAVIAGRGDDQAIGAPHGVEQMPGRLDVVRLLRVVHGQSKILGNEDLGRRPQPGRRAQGVSQRHFGRRGWAQRAADAQDDRRTARR